MSRQIRGPLVLSDTTVKTTAGNVVCVNDSQVIVKKTSGAATTVTLPSVLFVGQTLIVKGAKGDEATNAITVVPDGTVATTIDGAATFVISTAYGSATFTWNGVEWNVQSASGGAGNVTTLNVAGITTLANVVGVNAAGTVIANATAIVSAVNVVGVANDAAGVRLPTAVAGKVMEVYGSATNALLVYPPVNGTINGGTANAAVTIEGRTPARFVGTNATNWMATFTANS